MKWLLIGFIKAWRAIVSPWYGNICKYYPSCSAYGLEAVQTHGAIKGSGLTIWRILRCNPWSKGGYDPVPGTRSAYLWELEQAGLYDPDTGEMCGGTDGSSDCYCQVTEPDHQLAVTMAADHRGAR